MTEQAEFRSNMVVTPMVSVPGDVGAATNPALRQKRIVAAAMWGYYKRDQMLYDQVRTRDWFRQNFHKPPFIPDPMDCSSYVTWCYWCAGSPNPNGHPYSEIDPMWTGSLWGHGRGLGEVTSASQMKPGDLCFYGDPYSQNGGHVTVYVGFGQVVSMGQDSGPEKYAYTVGSHPFIGARRYDI
jgi:hypothetical protein